MTSALQQGDALLNVKHQQRQGVQRDAAAAAAGSRTLQFLISCKGRGTHVTKDLVGLMAADGDCPPAEASLAAIVPVIEQTFSFTF